MGLLYRVCNFEKRYDMNSLHNKIVLITGGTKGIGFGVAQSLLAQGVNVAITGRYLETARASAR